MSCFWRRDYCSIQFNSRAVGWNDFCSPGQDHLYFTSSPQKLHERASARVSPFPGTTCACMTRLQMNGATQAVGANFSNYLPCKQPPNAFTTMPIISKSHNCETPKGNKLWWSDTKQLELAPKPLLCYLSQCDKNNLQDSRPYENLFQLC